MFLFEGNFGNILHTGDCRLTPECLQCLPDKYIGKKGKEPKCSLDLIFLDCTFAKFSLKMPSKYSAVCQVINCIWKHPDAAVVYLTCDLLGQEEILVEVSRTFGSKIFVDKEKNPECFGTLTRTAPQILSEDPSSRFHLLEGFPRLYERAKVKLAEAQANFQPEPLIVRPSAQWYVCDDEFLETEKQKQRKGRSSKAVKDQYGIWHICYSMHSSREELEWALQLLAPKWVASTIPSCRAMELDYVKKRCFSTQLASDDPLWRLLGIKHEAASIDGGLPKAVSCSSEEEVSIEASAECLLQPVKMSSTPKKLLTLSPGKKLPVTLFGRARLGLADRDFPHEECKLAPPAVEPPYDVSAKVEQHFSFKNTLNSEHQKSTENKASITEVHCFEGSPKQKKVGVKCAESLANIVDVTEVPSGKSADRKTDITEVQGEMSAYKDTKIHVSSYSPVGSSKSFNEGFRKLYRSMNVPVPEPLPSLVELMKANRRAKRLRF
ncbi:uncharacterized protein LOC127804860 isoform X2 [Diospyros lotus]|nr:uncharacterized protein LOC127804860 isoform X2 [Diospyros lotus]XP_052197876.1 uncharacterized protein LOC127804860 isoform X2 [Diospyros lotus]